VHAGLDDVFGDLVKPIWDVGGRRAELERIDDAALKGQVDFTHGQRVTETPMRVMMSMYQPGVRIFMPLKSSSFVARLLECRPSSWPTFATEERHQSEAAVEFVEHFLSAALVIPDVVAFVVQPEGHGGKGHEGFGAAFPVAGQEWKASRVPLEVASKISMAGTIAPVGKTLMFKRPPEQARTVSVKWIAMSWKFPPLQGSLMRQLKVLLEVSNFLLAHSLMRLSSPNFSTFFCCTWAKELVGPMARKATATKAIRTANASFFHLISS